MFKPDDCVFDASGADHIEAKRHYTKDAQLIDQVVNVIRKEAELIGLSTRIVFQITKSFGGGTSSRLHAVLLMKVQDNYPGRIIAIFSVCPSPKVLDVVVKPYATLSIHQLLENGDKACVIDNESLYNLSHKYNILFS